MIVRPRHGDDELGLRLDLAFLGLGIHRQQRDEKQERDDLQALEEHEAEGIELLARIITEAVHHALARERTRRKPQSDRWQVRKPSRSRHPGDSTASAAARTRSGRSAWCTWQLPCRRSSGPWNSSPRPGWRYRAQQSGLASK